MTNLRHNPFSRCKPTPALPFTTAHKQPVFSNGVCAVRNLSSIQPSTQSLGMEVHT
jgi:hypothetical protein